MQAIRDLGLLDLEPVDVKGTKIAPRDVAVAVIGPRLTKPESEDLVALRVTVSGTSNGAPKTVGWQLIDRYNTKHGISAMMRTTGYSLAITGLFQVRGLVKERGVRTPDEAMPGREYVAELSKRGIDLQPISV
jgi:lysine 6-dehydrogenase